MANPESIHSIYMSLRGRLARALFGMVPPKEVEDIIQETYVRICQIERKDKIQKPRSFLFRTARNLALDHLKRSESRLAVSMEDVEELGSGGTGRLADETFEQVATSEEFSRFCEAVRQLPLQYRRAFVLKKVYGYTQREIAREMNLSESTVEKHIAQGVKRCTYYMMQYVEQRHDGKRTDQLKPEQHVSASRRRD